MTIICDIWNSIMLKCKHINVGKNCKIFGRIYIHGQGHITMGDNCIIRSGERYNPTSYGGHTHIVAGDNAEILIGNNVGMSNVYITAQKKIIIEDNVMLGAGTRIWDTDFHPSDYSKRMKDEKPQSKDVLIKFGAFIGADTIVLKGTTIGKRAVIGAGSVVTKNIPDDEMWAGNPARFIKRIED